MTDRDHPEIIQPGEPKAPPTEETEKKLGLSMLAKVALVAVVISSFVISISCVMHANQLRRQSEELQAELDAYSENIKQLVYYINKEVDDQYIIDYAREHFGMYFPDEDIYYNDVNE